MKNYIVFDLEWNQSPNGKADSIADLPFEIIEIGAVKLNESFEMTDNFHRLIRPCVYRQIHYAISEVTHMDIGELKEHGERFTDVAKEFMDWCGGKDMVFCSWGPMDLTELQRNMAYFGMKARFDWPLLYYDIQKLYALAEPDMGRVSLDTVVEHLNIREECPFHRALDDAYYTGKVLQTIAAMDSWDRIRQYYSVDYYRVPQSRKEEFELSFPDYSKFVSRAFENRDEAVRDRRVAEISCPECGRILRRKIRWFSSNQKIYYALAYCPEHGYVKGKIRMKHLDGSKVFAVRTVKVTDDEGAKKIRERRDRVCKKHEERLRKEENRTVKGDHRSS